jgi:hypothetical protein
MALFRILMLVVVVWTAGCVGDSTTTGDAGPDAMTGDASPDVVVTPDGGPCVFGAGHFGNCTFGK